MSLFFEDENNEKKKKSHLERKNFKVRCINDSPFAEDIIVEGDLVKGRVYNVEGVVETSNGHGFNLTGMSIKHASGQAMAFAAHRFKVLQ